MKIMSFNTQHCLNYVEGKIDFEIIANKILNCDADVVGLNEMRGIGRDPEYTAQVERLAELTGMKYFYFAKAIDVPEKGPYGNAILSKIPMMNAEAILIPDPEIKKYSCTYETRCVLKAELEGGVTVLVTHFGLNLDEQENAVETIVKALSHERCILMGDFNVTPEDTVLDPIRDKMKDTAEAFDMPKLSFPSDNPQKKIDYIFVSHDIEVEYADIPPIIASDHLPHIAKVKI
ncbi:MAG: endonuclease/exonuclease/phosphatase family protein [Clostridia bacterium]|nr:endonuclease/exonuclease/phosphatase family protein [Clostridia bacterium]